MLLVRLAWLVVVAGCAHEVPVCRPAPEPAATVLRATPGLAAAAIIEHTVWITPEIRADTRVQVETPSAQVTFLSGSQVMLVIALSQGANTAIAERGAAVGTARIDAGLRLDFQIATPLQSGAVYLDGTFASSNLPSVHFKGALVTWSSPALPISPAVKE
jgi:hypothetical protein